MANKPTPQIDPLPGMGPLGIPKPQTDERVCSDKCQEIHILAHPGLPPMSYTKHAAECAIGQYEARVKFYEPRLGQE